MKIDKTTYEDKKERYNGMTADRTNQPDKVLFFTDSHFLFFKSLPTFGTLPFALPTSQRFAKVKEPKCPLYTDSYLNIIPGNYIISD